MAIMVLFSGEGITKEMYESLRKEVDWEHKHPLGGMFHVAGFGKGSSGGKEGIRVVDLWASESDFNNFVTNRLMPVMEKIKAPPPKVEIFEVHNVNAFPSLDKHKVPAAK